MPNFVKLSYQIYKFAYKNLICIDKFVWQPYAIVVRSEQYVDCMIVALPWKIMHAKFGEDTYEKINKKVFIQEFDFDRSVCMAAS